MVGGRGGRDEGRDCGEGVGRFGVDRGNGGGKCGWGGGGADFGGGGGGWGARGWGRGEVGVQLGEVEDQENEAVFTAVVGEGEARKAVALRRNVSK